MLQDFDFYGWRKRKKEMVEKMKAKYGSDLIHEWGIESVFQTVDSEISERNKLEQDFASSAKAKKKDSEESDFQKALNVIFKAYDDKLLGNPMQGFLKELIFSRYLGHKEIPNGEGWKDCNQCFVCEHWDKVIINFQEDDAIVDKAFESIIREAERARALLKQDELEQAEKEEQKEAHHSDDYLNRLEFEIRNPPSQPPSPPKQ